jgi:hypothetical protein
MIAQEQIDKYKNKIINIVVIFFALVIAVNIYKGKASEFNSLKVRISEEGKKNLEFEKINRMEKKIGSYKELFVNREASLVMADINNIAKGADVKVLSIKPSQNESADDYSKDIFEVAVNAPSYDILAKFINTVESFSNVYMVEGMEVSYKDQLKKNGLTAILLISSVVAN